MNLIKNENWSSIKNSIDDEILKEKNIFLNDLNSLTINDKINIGSLIDVSIYNNFVKELELGAKKCTCNCNYCTCNCNYCECNCNYCTCNCNYSCTCNCNY